MLESGSGEAAGSLLAAMDACSTPAGRRRLKDWLCRPLGQVPAITARQDAVQELMGPAAEVAAEARASFAGRFPTPHAWRKIPSSALAAA